MIKIVILSLRTFVAGAVVLGVVLFLPAWTLAYWKAWVFIGVFLVSVNLIGIFLYTRDPQLLERRKKIGPAAETSVAQKLIMTVAIVGSVGMLALCGFDHRFEWSLMSPGVSLAGDVLVAFGLLLNLLVFRENSYGGSTIETVEGQRVISTGPYALVRHPMYVGVLVMLIGIPLALGSWWGLAILALAIPGLIARILDEERLLRKELPGYSEYTQTVRYRLVPHLW